MVLDLTLWVLTSLLMGMGFYVQYFMQGFEHIALVWGSAAFMFLIALWVTSQGRNFRSYALNARAELSRVIWPKRHDITVTTIF